VRWPPVARSCRLSDGAYVRVTPEEDGTIEGAEFPGLRLDVAKTLAFDRAGVLAALDR
jgi:hypothetical protein